mmetsp:Transcript_22747/g.36787  ORF Transcript_22747/g.36787 Transcript_22747/m.36787 type:complete len:407 (+) Transcript_22747:327-1547(+)
MNVNAENWSIGSVNKSDVFSFLCDTGCDILPDANYTDDGTSFIAPSGGIQQNVDLLPIFSYNRELEVGHFTTVQRICKHLLHRVFVVICDEFLNEFVPDHIIFRVASHVAGLLVPHVDDAFQVDTKDGRVGRVNELLILSLLGDTGRDVLPDANHANDGPSLVSAGGGIQKDFHSLAPLGDQWEFKVCHLPAIQGIVQHILYRVLVIRSDVVLNQPAAHDIFLSVARDLGGGLVPHVDHATHVDAEDGRVGRVDQPLVLPLLGNTGCDVLADANDANNSTTGISARGCVQQDFHSLFVFGDDGKLKVRHLYSIQSFAQHLLDRDFVIISDKLFNELLADDIIFCVACHITCLLIPDIHNAFFIDAKNWGISCVNQFFILTLLSNASCDVLPNANHTNNATLVIPPR